MGLIKGSTPIGQRLRHALCALGGLALLSGCAAGGGAVPGTTAAVSPQGPAASTAGPLEKRGRVKIALLLPLTAKGGTAKIAKGLKQAGELAVFEFDNPSVVLIARDTKGTPEGARAAAESAVRHGAELVIGPLFSKSVAAAAAVTRAAGVPMIAFSSDRSVAGRGVYLLSFLAGQDVPRIVSYTAGQGRGTFAALIPKTAYGRVVEAAFRQAVSQAGGRLAALEYYPLDANGMLDPVRRIKAAMVNAQSAGAPIDALFIPGGADTMPTMAQLMPYFEIDTKQVKLIGTGDWDYANIGREKPLIGGWYAAPDPRGWRAFTQRYAKTYGTVPPRIASLAYDAVSLAMALANNPPGQRYTPANLTRISGFAGVDGLFRLHGDGTSERGFAILEVQRFGPRVIDPAPSVFGPAQISRTDAFRPAPAFN